MRVKKFFITLFPISITIIIFDKIKLPFDPPISIYRPLQMFILLLMFITILTKRNIKSNSSSLTTILLYFFVFFTLISTLFARNLTNSLLRTFQIGEFTIMVLILFFYLKIFWDISYVKDLAQLMCWLGIFSGVTIISDFFGWTDFVTIIYDYRGYGRQVGILGEPNFAAGKLAIFLPFIIYASFKNQKEGKMVKSRIYAILSLVVSIAILMTGSRMGIIMLVITFTFIILKERKYLISIKSAKTFIILCLFLLIIGTTFWQNAKFRYLATHRVGSLYHFITIGEKAEGIDMRLELLKPSWQMFSTNPILGLGPGGYRWELPQYVPSMGERPSHNTFIDVLVGIGIFGFLFFVGILIQIAYNIRSLRKIMPLKNLSFYFGLSFLNLLVMLFFLSHLHNRFLWGMFIPISMVIEWNKKAKKRKYKKLVNAEDKSE